MSRWLKNVNTLLEKLDENTATAAPAAAEAAMNIVRSAQKTAARSREDGGDDDDYDDDDESYNEEEEDGEYTEESNDEEDIDDRAMSSRTESGLSEYQDAEEEQDQEQHEEQELLSADSTRKYEEGETQTLFLNERVPTKDPILATTEAQEEASSIDVDHEPPEAKGAVVEPPVSAAAKLALADKTSDSKPPLVVQKPLSLARPSPAPRSLETKQQAKRASAPPPPHIPNSSAGTIGTNTNSGSTSRLQQLKKAHAAELSKMQTELDAVKRELKAVNQELHSAAGLVEQERQAAKEERDELLEEQEEEMQQLKDDYAAQIQQLKKELKEQKKHYLSQLSQTEQQRQQEGGNMAEELQETESREKAALERVEALKQESLELQAENVSLKQQNATLQERLDAAHEGLATAQAAAAAAEEKLDATTEHHKQQLQKRLVREQQLERTVAELSRVAAAPLPHKDTVHSDRSQAVVQEHKNIAAQFKEQYHLAAEELESAKTDLLSANQRCEALEFQLRDVARERDAETAQHQQTLREYDARLQELTVTANQRLSSVGGGGSSSGGGESSAESTGENYHQQRENQLTRELNTAKTQLASLSDQLMRQQGTAEASKSEVLALKGRLQVAIERAEAAERQQYATSEIELGASSSSYTGSKARRRRVKGGSARFGSLPSRSIRGAVGLHVPQRGSALRQIGVTIDAVDTWMLETGNILRHEPLARLGFFLYMTIVHLWCFGLVFFHTVESEHGDLGQLTDHSRMGVLHHDPAAAAGPAGG